MLNIGLKPPEDFGIIKKLLTNPAVSIGTSDITLNKLD